MTDVKPIQGSWFEFEHHNKPEGRDWSGACAAFTCQQWQLKIQEMAEARLQYLVLLAVALDHHAYYPTQLLPLHELACEDPIEAVLAAADRHGMRFFISNDWFGDWRATMTNLTDPAAGKARLQAMNELAARYGHHPSFYGWYFPDELCIDPHFSEEFIGYVNTASREAHRLTPQAKILIAPYGTNRLHADDKFVSQLDRLDVDIVAYQDEVGVRKATPEETPRYYEALRKAHDRAQRAALWADVEIFEFESDVYRSALLPAAFPRVLKQLEAVSPFADTILVYQYLGMMNKPGTQALAGRPESCRLYCDYMNWLAHQAPDTLTTT